MEMIFLQLIVGGCFIGLIIVLFLEETDYLSYSILLVVIASIATAIMKPSLIVGPGETGLEFFVGAINWEIIFFLISIFTIVQVLTEKKIFQKLALIIVEKNKENIRRLFYVFCIISTLSAAFIEDISVALMFGPIILLACKKLGINPAPFLLGMTITINLASTLTPFGSAENVLIADQISILGENPDELWFVTYLGIYFLGTTAITLYSLDRTIFSSEYKKPFSTTCELETALQIKDLEDMGDISRNSFIKNIIALFIFVFLLIIIPEIYIAGIIGMVIFIFLNPIENKKGKRKVALSHYLRELDYKLVYFFICLFIFVELMEVNGTLNIFISIFQALPKQSEFLIALIVLLITSLLSGFMDNAPVTVIFIPIINSLITSGFGTNALVIAFVIGVNIGGNYLPQGSAADMATLDISQRNCIVDLSFKRLFKVGSKYALLHILIGIGYIAIITLFFN